MTGDGPLTYSSLPWREGKREGDYYKTSPSPNLSLLRERDEEGDVLKKGQATFMVIFFMTGDGPLTYF